MQLSASLFFAIHNIEFQPLIRNIVLERVWVVVVMMEWNEHCTAHHQHTNTRVQMSMRLIRFRCTTVLIFGKRKTISQSYFRALLRYHMLCVRVCICVCRCVIFVVKT